MLQVGTLVGPILKPLDTGRCVDSVKGKCYHLHLETQGIPTNDETTIARFLVDELYRRFKADIVWIRIEDGTIDAQLYGSPFAWALLLGFLPELLLGLGVIIALASVWSVISSVPSWAWALLAIGGILVFLGPTIGKSLIPRPPPQY